MYQRKNVPVDEDKINVLRNANWSIAKIAAEMDMEQHEVRAVLRRLQKRHEAGETEV